MFDYCLIDNFRDLVNILFINDVEIDQGNFLMRYRRGDIRKDLVKYMIG